MTAINKKFGNSTIEIVEGDITLLDSDAIVNAANAQLQLGGGVAGAIRNRGGDSIQRECDEIGGTFVGGAVITGGGELKARHVIHAAGPRMGEGDEDEKLENATLNSLKVADENNLKSIAFPAISTGIFGYPVERCARIMIKTTADYLAEGSGIKTVTFCLFGEETKNIFVTALESI